MLSKYRFWIVLGSMLIGIVLVVQAQDNPPLSQPTIDAAVSTLIAQTQQPQMMATQTIQAALFQALTATAVAQTAQPTPMAQPTQTAPSTAATIENFDASHLTVAGTTDIDLLAGPTGTSAYLAPDGSRFAYFKQKKICLYAGDQQQNCIDLSDKLSNIDSETIRWSPDSRYIAFTEEFFRSFRDPDIWVLDTTDMTATDLTDDGVKNIEISDNDWKNIDVFPRWTQDDQIIFLRYGRSSGQITSPEIHRIAPDGSGDTVLGTVNDYDEPFSIYSLDVGNNNQLAYGFAAQRSSPSDGVWISDLDGKNAHQLTHESDQGIITNVQFSPDSRYVLVNAEQKAPLPNPTPAASRMYVVDSSSGKVSLIDPDHYVTGAGWSPEGSALVYITHNDLDPSNPDAVFLTNAAGSPGQQLTSLQGKFNIATPLLRTTLSWGKNNTILLSNSPGTGIVLVHLQ